MTETSINVGRSAAPLSTIQPDIWSDSKILPYFPTHLTPFTHPASSTLYSFYFLNPHLEDNKAHHVQPSLGWE